eukprot:7065227-Prymnesium_polylepis.1
MSWRSSKASPFASAHEMCVCVLRVYRDGGREQGTREGTRKRRNSVCVTGGSIDGTWHADGAREGDAQQTRRGHARS